MSQPAPVSKRVPVFSDASFPSRPRSSWCEIFGSSARLQFNGLLKNPAIPDASSASVLDSSVIRTKPMGEWKDSLLSCCQLQGSTTSKPASGSCVNSCTAFVESSMNILKVSSGMFAGPPPMRSTVVSIMIGLLTFVTLASFDSPFLTVAT